MRFISTLDFSLNPVSVRNLGCAVPLSLSSRRDLVGAHASREIIAGSLLRAVSRQSNAPQESTRITRRLKKRRVSAPAGMQQSITASSQI